MKINFKTQATTTLESAQRFVEYLSTEMSQFCERLEEARKNNKISVSYFNETTAIMKKHINDNNELIMQIDKELQSRIKKAIPGLVSFTELDKIGKSFQEEISRYSSISTTNQKKESPVIDFKGSKEKKHDNQ